MRALVQRVKRSSVWIDGKLHSNIGRGLLILLGIRLGDSDAEGKYLAERCASLRIFEDADGKMNLSVKDVGGEALVVSQFTLYGDTRKGHRPSYSDAAPPTVAEKLYDRFVDHLKSKLGHDRVATGVFRAMMEVELVNDGPVTLIIDSKNSSNIPQPR